MEAWVEAIAMSNSLYNSNGGIILPYGALGGRAMFNGLCNFDGDIIVPYGGLGGSNSHVQ